ncbi:G-protein coupled receptor Mth2-like isoform X1 [Hylaeus volcanicus]|uniref:G-protein coupled receptor Mth2-like isoform X1 n=1 Tax=Hylaeus volcanicus TaxID=313075 RepID=UPI0023B87207|nr:G-protein coupled receptor Mth2-like isoform X1 [Hylaeus volcanicus]
MRLRVTTVIRVISFSLLYWLGPTGTEVDASSNGDSFCQAFAAIVLEPSKTSRFKNGSLMYEELVYPVGSYREVGNETYGCPCNLRTCLKKCCRRNEMLGVGDRPNCTRLPNEQLGRDLVLERSQLAPEIERVYVIDNYTGCPGNLSRYMLEPEKFEEDKFVVERNGSLQTSSMMFPTGSYCLDWKESVDKIAALVCLSTEVLPNSVPPNEKTYYKFGLIVSIPFLLATFLVYAIIPELRNLYGKTLMCYVASLLVAYTFLELASLFYIAYGLCSAIALVIHFSFLASFFWLNVMCFDIWWTFRGFRSLQGSAKQRERKKFMIYSIYAWGCASILTGISILMHFLPDIPKHFVRPEFGEESCWFAKETAKAIYFYGPMGVTILCNICLFVSTALKIVRHKKDTARHFKDADSKRHDDHKQWFNLYLKLFIVMGINWSMEIISWLCNNSPEYIWYLTDITNTLQGVIIFFIFVWKDKVKQHLLKRLCCRDDNILSRNSTRSAYHSSTTRSTYPFSSESARTVK